jgi:hypothetical protein
MSFAAATSAPGAFAATAAQEEGWVVEQLTNAAFSYRTQVLARRAARARAMRHPGLRGRAVDIRVGTRFVSHWPRICIHLHEAG